MTRYRRPSPHADIVNPFPGIVALERALGHGIRHRIGSNEGLPYAQPDLQQHFGAAFAELARLYPDPSALALRECIAAQQQLAVDQIVFDAGADSLILLCLRTVCEPGDVVITSAGTYPTFRYFAEGLAARVHEVPYRELRPDLARLADMAQQQRAKLVYLANPDNPTGHFYDSASIDAFRQALPEDTLLVLDEAYIDFAPAAPTKCVVMANTVRLRTLSKAYAAAGLRLGYALADADWVQHANQLRIHYAVSNIAHAAGLLLLQDVTYKQHLIAQTLALREQLSTALTAAAIRPDFLQILPSATNFIAVRYSDPTTTAVIQKQLWQREAAVHRPPHPALQHLLRITANPAALMPELIAVLAGH